RKASSPKSLSKVMRTRFSAMARSSTWRSLLPGASVRTQATSWPRLRSASTASAGKFSLASSRMLLPQRIDLFGLQPLTGVGQTGAEVLVCQARIIAEYVGLRPVLGHQVDENLDGQARALNHGFAGQYCRVQHNTLLPAHGLPSVAGDKEYA